MNIYKCSEADLAGIQKVGQESARKIVALRNAVLAKQRQPIEVADLVLIRNTEEYWQEKIASGVISLKYPSDNGQVAEAKGATGSPSKSTTEYITKEQFSQLSHNLMTEMSKQAVEFQTQTSQNVNSSLEKANQSLKIIIDEIQSITTNQERFSVELKQLKEDQGKHFPHIGPTGIMGGNSIISGFNHR